MYRLIVFLDLLATTVFLSSLVLSLKPKYHAAKSCHISI